MAIIYNSELTKELIKGAKIQTARDNVPNQIAEKVVPVMEVNPRLLKTSQIIKRYTLTNATNANIYTTPTNQDFYLTGASLSMIKDATSTSTSSYINVTIDGLAVAVLMIPEITLTAQNDSMSIVFPFPIKIDRNTNVQIFNATNVANITSIGIIYGYLDESSNA